jgi:hypothetical protein
MIILTIIIFSCNDDEPQKPGTTEVLQVALKDYSIFADAGDYDSLLLGLNCTDEEDSLMDDRIGILEDSIASMYDQLIIRMQRLSKVESHKQFAEPFLQSLQESKKNSIETTDTDTDLLLYSSGKATGSGTEARCYKIALLQRRLLLLRAVFANSYWNYGFDTLK